MSEQQYCRFPAKDREPTNDDIHSALGERPSKLWDQLNRYLQDSYDFLPEKKFYGKSYGWTIQYRKSGKTLCSFFPETGAFTVLVTLGRNELSRLQPQFKELDPGTGRVIENAHEYHEGKWLWIRVMSQRQVEDIETLVACKRKPRLQ